MTVMTREPEAQPDKPRPNTLLRQFLSLKVPDGYRAQLIDGEIVVSPPPGGNHEECLALIQEQVYTRSKVRMHTSGNKGLVVPNVEGYSRVIPDLTIAPKELRLFVDAPSWMRPSGVEVVVEVTSGLADIDRQSKRRAYAAARIPLYLLVGRDDKTVTLFSGPARDTYATTTTVPFGEPLDLPAPFEFTLDTDGFVA